MKDVSKRVYFAKCIGPTGEPIGAYKIGCSHGYNDRLKQIAANLPFTLEPVASVPGNVIMEAACHLFLKPYRISGEYFRACDEVEAFIGRAADRGEAFRYFSTNEGAGVFRGVELRAVEGFLYYHGLDEADVCARQGVQRSVFKKQRENKMATRRFVAAAGVLLAEQGEFSTWPDDALEGLCGKRARRFMEAAE